MQNARKEIEDITVNDIKCATIDLVITNWESKDCGSYEEEDHISANLPVGYTQEEYDNFMKKLDVEYNAGYGMQELFGTIWLKDGTWFDRTITDIPDDISQSVDDWLTDYIKEIDEEAKDKEKAFNKYMSNKDYELI